MTNATGPGNEQYLPTTDGLAPLYNTSNQRALESFGVQMLADFSFQNSLS